MKASPFNWERAFLLAGAAVVIICLLGYGGYRYLELRGENFFLEERIAGLEGRAIGFEKKITELERSLASSTDDLARVNRENSDLTQNLRAEQRRNSAFESQIQEISGTVGALKKLSETDPELLKKYSRVYFLNENYAPAQLSSIDSQYLYDKNKPQLIHSGVPPYLEGLLAAANRDGVNLKIISAYRSFYEQVSVKLGYKVTYGAGTANKFSADQGYSEHQLGTAVDFTTPEIKEVFLKFEKSLAYTWLTQNAYKFGFTLSYPQNNSYYQFESWHWRFIGVALATNLHDKNEYFYNLAQGDIDQYLIEIFN